MSKKIIKKLKKQAAVVELSRMIANPIKQDERNEELKSVSLNSSLPKEKRIKQIRKLIKKGADPDNIKMEDKGSRIQGILAMFADRDHLSQDDLDVCRVLLELGANPNIDSGGYTPLFYAFSSRRIDDQHKKLCSLLLEFGAFTGYLWSHLDFMARREEEGIDKKEMRLRTPIATDLFMKHRTIDQFMKEWEELPESFHDNLLPFYLDVLKKMDFDRRNTQLTDAQMKKIDEGRE